MLHKDQEQARRSLRSHVAFRSARFKSLHVAVIALAGLGLATFTVVAMNGRLWRGIPSRPVRTIGVPQAPTTVVSGSQDYIQRVRLRPQLRQVLLALGDRLERPGKERLVMTGTLSFTRSENLQCQLILEVPQRMRLETPEGVIAFDGQNISTTKQSLTRTDEKLLDTLLFDTAERFLSAQTKGVATRFLGSRFRLDDGSDRNYAGPFYDIYQVEEQIALLRAAEQGPKRYYFDSSTLLLERVRYAVDGGGGPGQVEIIIGQWEKVNNQNVPRIIRRIENGEPVFTLTVTSATVNPRVDDWIFGSR